MALLLKADGATEPINERLTLDVMQRLVGGYIELVTIGRTPDGREALIVDEEGLLKGKPVNRAATSLYRGAPPTHEGVIVGDAIRCVVTAEGSDDEAYS